MNTISYLKTSVDHINEIMELRFRFITDFWGPQPAEKLAALRENDLLYLGRAIPSGQFICWLAMSGNTAVGTGALLLREQPGNLKNPSGRWGYVFGMYTLPEYRRRGICSNIIERLIASGKEAGITAFELHATEEGQHVYPKQGFEMHNEPTYRMYV